MGKSAKEIILEIICPTLGVFMANIMFSAPYRAVTYAVARGYLGDLNPTPWAFVTGNCLGWLAYSFMTDDFFLYFANAPGLILSIWLNLCAAKLQYSDYRSRSMRQSFVHYMGTSQRRRLSIYAEDKSTARKAQDFGKTVLRTVMFQKGNSPAPHEKLVVGIVMGWLGVLSLVFFANFTQDTRKTIVGVVVNCNLVFFYGAPLTTIFNVLKTRNSASIHTWTMITNTVNGTFWTAYGFAILDPFVFVPNAIGAGLGLIQVMLVCTFPRRHKDELKETMNEFVHELGPIEEGESNDDSYDPYRGIDQISDPSASDDSDEDEADKRNHAMENGDGHIHTDDIEVTLTSKSDEMEVPSEHSRHVHFSKNNVETAPINGPR